MNRREFFKRLLGAGAACALPRLPEAALPEEEELVDWEAAAQDYRDWRIASSGAISYAVHPTSEHINSPYFENSHGIAVFDRVLTAAEIAGLYSQGHGYSWRGAADLTLEENVVE